MEALITILLIVVAVAFAMAAVTETEHDGEFIVSEMSGHGSRETITLAAADLDGGEIIGKVLTAGTAAGRAKAGNTGNGTMGAVTVSAGALPGIYTLTVTRVVANAGDFSVQDPTGKIIGSGAVAVAFSQGGLAFTLADGATDFGLGDQFFIDVVATTWKWYRLAPTDNTGKQNAAGILFRDTKALAADKTTVAIVRNAEVNESEIDYDALTADQKKVAKEQLALLNIIVRGAI